MKELKIMLAAGVMMTFFVMNGCGSKQQNQNKYVKHQVLQTDTSYISEMEMIELKEEWKFALAIICDKKGLYKDERSN